MTFDGNEELTEDKAESFLLMMGKKMVGGYAKMADALKIYDAMDAIVSGVGCDKLREIYNIINEKNPTSHLLKVMNNYIEKYCGNNKGPVDQR